MDNKQIHETAKDLEELFRLVMKMYWDYLGVLDKYIQQTPGTETALLKEITEHVNEVQAALDHDIGIFQKAIDSDTEDLHGTRDQLQISAIYQKLKQND
jgi:hypothetical protein